jgi:hypothetical protein
MSATTTEMIAEIAALRKHKQQIEDGLAMLGSDNPLNVILRLRLQHDLSEGREQSQAQIYTLSREHDAEVDSLRGEIWTLEEQLSEANGKVIEQKAELSEMRGSMMMTEQCCQLLTQTVAKLTEQLSEAKSKVIEQNAELSELKESLSQAENSYHLLHIQLDNESEAVAVLTRTVDSLHLTIQSDFASSEKIIHKLTEERDRALWAQIDAAAVSVNYEGATTEIARKETVILKLTRERDIWKNRHAVVTQSATRLRGQVDEAQKKILIAEPSKTASRSLNPTAPEFVPSKPAQTLKEAVQARVAAMATQKPTLTVTELYVPNHETDTDAYTDFCVSLLHSMINECAATNDSANKISVAIRLFSFVKDHGMPLLRAHAKFRLTVLAKCWEFKAHESSTAELTALLDWVLDQFKDEHPALSPYDCGDCARCFRYLASSIIKLADTQTNATPGPIKRIPAPSAPSAPVKRYRTRTLTGVIRRINYAEESDSE